MFLKGEVQFVPGVVFFIGQLVFLQGGPEGAGDAVGIFPFVGEGCHEGVAASVWESGAGGLVPAVQVGVGTPDGPAG